MNIPTKIQKLINKQYEYIANDINPSNGNDIFIFKESGVDGKKFAVEVYEWVD